MNNFQFYAANLYSLDCEKSALLYSRLFSIPIISITKNHSELRSDLGFSIFFDKPSMHCNATPGCISFALSEVNLDKINLEPLQLECYYEKEKYASFLDEYSNRIWLFEKKSITS